ncbi:uncharacterized protein JCM10292_005095 [Rhodotorula paludigena]|uniref:uncharacterized protein n=1 Tax=Rhodotorula paludigena TaxID=86838 RepID=UPI00316C6E70
MAPASSSSAVPATLDDLVALIAATDAQDVAHSLIPQLKKLDKAAATPAKPAAAAAASASTSTPTSAAPAPSGSKDTSKGKEQQQQQGHVLEGKLKDGQDPLAVLDPAAHSVGFLYILNARLGASEPKVHDLLQRAQEWAVQFDPEQARLVPEQVLYLAHSLCHLAEQSNQWTLPVQPLAILVDRFPLPGYLTQLHPLFLRVVMQSQMYPAAQDLLMKDITDIDKTLHAVKYQDHLLYHYLGGTILALLGEYARAAELLEICVSAPGSSASTIQLDAYKKLVLVQLLAFGKTQPLPKYTSSAVSTAIKALCGAYSDFAVAFASLERARVVQVLEKAGGAFEKDHNLGLVLLVESSLRRRQILNLTETYITLSLGDIAAHVGADPGSEEELKAVEDEIKGMVAARQLFATLSPPAASAPSSAAHSSTIVTFSDDPEPYLSPETVARVTRAIEQVQRLDRRWSDEAERIEESRDFVQKAWNAAATGPSLAGAGATGGGLSAFTSAASGVGFSDDFDYAGGGGGAMGSPGVGGGEGWGDEGGFVEMESD